MINLRRLGVALSLSLLGSACSRDHGRTEAPATPSTPAAPATPTTPAAPATPTTPTAPATPAATSYTVRSIALPGAPADGVYMDYLAYDRAHHRVWVPAGNTGSVDVIDAAEGDHLSRIEGFATAEVERHGHKWTMGPSSVTLGDGVAYVGNRADSTVCAIDITTLEKGACVKLDSMPDGVAYVAAKREVWVTMPRDNSIRVLDVSKPGTIAVAARIDFEGQPEGYAVDEAGGRFFTNLEDKDRTLAIDSKSRTVAETWQPGCGDDGPRGLALDRRRGFLLVACTDHVVLLDTGHGGKRLGELDTGDGVDNIDYVESGHLVYAVAARAARLTVARVDDQGTLTALAAVDTARGARNPVATDEGAVYFADSPDGKILVAAPATR